MSVEQEPVETTELPANEPAAPMSLKERMARRRDELASRTTELFPVPRYDELLAVELRAIPWEDSEHFAERHQRAAKRMLLNTAADEIVSATIAFHEIKEDGTTEVITDAERWSDVCSRLLDQELPPAPPSTQERISLLTLCTDQGVITLNAVYRRWLGGANTGIGEEVKRDFNSTR
jgi:hypothetical protein